MCTVSGHASFWPCGVTQMWTSQKLPLLLKMHGIWQVDSQENYQRCCHQMLDFSAKMHQIHFRPGLCSRHRWGNLQRSPDPWLYLRGLLLREWKGEKGKGMGNEGAGKGRAKARGGERRRHPRFLRGLTLDPYYGFIPRPHASTDPRAIAPSKNLKFLAPLLADSQWMLMHM